MTIPDGLRFAIGTAGQFPDIESSWAGQDKQIRVGIVRTQQVDLSDVLSARQYSGRYIDGSGNIRPVWIDEVTVRFGREICHAAMVAVIVRMPDSR